MNAPYHIGAKNYLARARARLDSNSKEDLFYAAFELRCGIESRMREYLIPYDHISENEKKSWKLGVLSKSCDKYFNTHQQVQKILVKDVNGKRVITLLYIPVSKELIKAAQQLGDYLHDQKKYPTDAWWEKFKNFLEEVYSQLKICCSGSLLGPMLKEQGGANSNIEYTEETKEFHEFIKLSKGKKITLKVEYLDIDQYKG